MESVTTQDIGVNDLRWIIDYRPERCTMCGSCVASCTLNALEVAVMRQDLTVSRASQPEPVREHLARPVIRQKASLTGSCVGCGMCEKVCPNQAIRAVRNPDSRYALLARRFSHRKSERHFRNQMPMSGQIPCTTHLVVNQRIIVLQ